MSAVHTLFLCLLDLFGTSYILRVLTAQGELCQSQRIGTVGRGLTGRDQLIGGGYRIVDLGYYL